MTTQTQTLGSLRYNPVYVIAPMALWTLSLLCDLASRLGQVDTTGLVDVSYRLSAIGIVVAVALAIWSATDMRSFRGANQQSEIALTREALLLGAILLAIASIFWREVSGFVTQAPAGSIGLTALAIALLAGCMASHALAVNASR